MKYPLSIVKEGDGTITVTCPDFDEIRATADTFEQALACVELAVADIIAERLQAFADIPVPTKANGPCALVPLALDIKVQLLWTLKQAGLTRADLARLTGWPRTKVDRLFYPHHQAKLAHFEDAFAALNKTVILRLESVPQFRPQATEELLPPTLRGRSKS
ncbi:hypothetical protein RM190_08650 [Paracoccus sp. CPCC 101403]|uniref:Type II toxin-antitoxin system HicB family antitoxin n=1 Tax=Paracoccus broussonetiae TaxID=3075834 RepID=A0ABU3ECG5_9RHOB|nr:hypothetical protein [Paracoccus sp. CPCC 101403]MDT1061922.1 hypothetical protein [Paracoccus sp. CPCC 101403]